MITSFGLFHQAGGEVIHLDLPVAEGITSAAFDYLSDVPVKSAKGLLVLVPGFNGNGATMLAEREWAEFAKANGLALGAFSPVSDTELLSEGGGYYDTAKGSGRILSDAVRGIGAAGLPLYLYGFSGGAHFIASFVENFPSHIAGWCAASFGEKRHRGYVNSKLSTSQAPPGIVACGTDDPRLGKALGHFHSGRELNRRWTWLEVPGLAHVRHPELETFVRRWFCTVMSKPKAPGIWVDIGSSEEVTNPSSTSKDLIAWLPESSLRAEWAALSRRHTQEVIEYKAKLKDKSNPVLTMFLRLPDGGERPAGVMCLCFLANNAGEVREMIRNGRNQWFQFANEHRLAVVGWGSRHLWDQTLNWDEIPHDRGKAIDASFDIMAAGWDTGIRWFAQHYGIPESGFLMTGSCGAGQFVQRLALRKPERFLAVHTNIPGSFDRPVRSGKTPLWCITTGERLAGGYERSLKFFSAVRALRFPIVYKAYPGVSHQEGTASSVALARACFEFALHECELATRRNGGRFARPDWEDIFASAAEIADIRNQMVFPIDDYASIPIEYRMLLPGDLGRVWSRE